MPWSVSSVMDQRIEFVVRAVRKEVAISQLCQEYGISRQTGHFWLRRYREEQSVATLQPRSRRPHTCPGRTAEEAEAAVVRVRQQYGWGARKLQVLLAEEGWLLTEPTINRILKRRGLLGRQDVRGQAPGRFARPECNQLWQMDFKGEYRIQEGKCYPLALLDDHSRYLMGLWPLLNQQAGGVQAALEGCFREYGVPQALLLDRGVPWWSTSNGHGLTQLSVWLLKQDLDLIYGRPYHPQTKGKIERYNRTLKERTEHEGAPSDEPAWKAWAVRLRQEYNEVRPHEALGRRRPAQVYTRVNLRPYQEQPRDYDYGAAALRQLNSQGCVTHQGQRYFVCEALANEWVRVDEAEPLLIVTYRTTTLREINLRTGRSRAILRPVHQTIG
jgi:transposase InsO family protein